MLKKVFMGFSSTSFPCLLLIAYCLVLTTGCAHAPMRSGYTGPEALPAQVSAYYDYPAQSLKAYTVSFLLKQNDGIRERLIRLPLIAPDFNPTEPVVEFEWFESGLPGKRPAIVFNPILGGDYYLERGLCRFFAEQGFHVALIHRKTLKVSPEHPVERLELLLRQGVLRIRQVVDWMSAQEAVDANRLGSFGISMGGIAGAVTAAVEPRLQAHVIALAGGPIADILMDSKDPMLTKARRRYLEQNRISAETLKARLQAAIRTDPIQLASYSDARDIFMFIALFDRTIGRSHSITLRDALGEPDVIYLPTGHYSAFIFLPLVKRESLRFFREHLG